MFIRDKYVFAIWQELRNSNWTESDKKVVRERALKRKRRASLNRKSSVRGRPLALATMTSRFRVKHGSRQRGLIAISRDFQTRLTRIQKRYMNIDNEFLAVVKDTEIGDMGRGRIAINDSRAFYISLYDIYSYKDTQIAFLCTRICLEFIIHNTIFGWIYKKIQSELLFLSNFTRYSLINFFRNYIYFWLAYNIFCYHTVLSVYLLNLINFVIHVWVWGTDQ